MPDLERLTDKLRLHLAKEKNSLDWEHGYQEGKSQARFEILMVAVGIWFALILIGYFWGG